jgi:hypothetical protein
LCGDRESTQHAPYTTKHASAIGVKVADADKEFVFLPRQFYEQLLKVVATKPGHPGNNLCTNLLLKNTNVLNFVTANVNLCKVSTLVVGELCGNQSWLGMIAVENTYKYYTYVLSDEMLHTVRQTLDTGSLTPHQPPPPNGPMFVGVSAQRGRIG